MSEDTVTITKPDGTCTTVSRVNVDMSYTSYRSGTGMLTSIDQQYSIGFDAKMMFTPESDGEVKISSTTGATVTFNQKDILSCTVDEEGTVVEVGYIGFTREDLSDRSESGSEVDEGTNDRLDTDTEEDLSTDDTALTIDESILSTPSIQDE